MSKQLTGVTFKMGKTYIETIKYMIVADFEVNGLVERPDVIGAIFGQSEGLLGANLDIKELQQNGKIGRIEIEYTQNQNKVRGILRLPCSVSMVETAIIAASIETIEKVGPCDAVFKVKQIEDTRGLKRQQIKERAIELLGKLMQEEIPDTKELMDDIMDTFKTKDIISYGSEKLAAGPTVDSSKELIVVEGRADVLNLLRYGFTNVVATGGARIPKSLEEISRNKIVTIFLDGDHGADIQQQQLLKSIKVDYIARAPDGKEVEELTQKEINKALRRRIKANSNYSSNNQFSTQQFNPNLTKQAGIVKATKFSTTNDHKLANPKFFENKPNKYLQHQQSTNRQMNDHNSSDVFNQLLSEIPDIERVDVSRDRDFRRSNDRDRSNYNRQKSFNDRNRFEKKEKQIYNKVKEETGRLQSKTKSSLPEAKPSIKEELIQQVSEGMQVKLDVPHTKGMEAPNKPIDDVKPEITKKEEIQEIPKKEKPKEEPKKKAIVLPKITDDMKASLSKIIGDIKDKKEARLLNEKFRRISSCSATDLENKLREFTSDKLFAIAVDQELNDTIKDLAKERGASILVVKNSNGIKDSQIHVLTYQELNK
ncbi:MAG TPA: DNA primase DnaG [archaeon]|jgi:DNA primase|nr:DNA primase DnaG [archaeon]HPV66479.1 DNA primase DnaG [archaeon]